MKSGPYCLLNDILKISRPLQFVETLIGNDHCDAYVDLDVAVGNDGQGFR